MNIVRGKELSEKILSELKQEISSKNLSPVLAIIQFGDEQPSNIYVQRKIAVGNSLGIKVQLHKFAKSEIEPSEKLLTELNSNPEIHGIIVQLPTPGLVPGNLLNKINPYKDVDGLTVMKLGLNWQNYNPQNLGATPKAIMYILNYIASHTQQSLEQFLSGKNVLIVNHSILIGKPLAGALVNNNATITIAHAQTRNLPELFRNADIIVTATGQSIITPDNASRLKQSVVIIDSGYSLENGKSKGDVDVDEVKDKASWLSPVPGGVGPVGVAMLMQNVYQAYLRLNSTQ